MQDIRFNKVRLPDRVQGLLGKAEERARSLSGESFRVGKHLFGRFLGCDLGNAILVVASTRTRPSTETIIVIETGDTPRVLVPAYDENDFAQLCRLLGAVTDDDVERVRDMLKPRPTLFNR